MSKQFGISFSQANQTGTKFNSAEKNPTTPVFHHFITPMLTKSSILKTHFALSVTDSNGILTSGPFGKYVGEMH